MSDQKSFSVIKLILFLLSLVTIGLFAYGAWMQPIFKVASEEKYLDFYNLIINNFPDLIKSTAKDKLFGIILYAFLLILLGGAVLFSGVAALVVFISGLISLFSKKRLKAVWLLVASGFHLAFVSVLSSSYYITEKVELGLGGILIVAGVALSVVIYALEDCFCGNNKTGRHLVGTLMRMAISGGFIYISLFCFSDIYIKNGETQGFGQTLFSDYVYLTRIEENIPKKFFAFVGMGTFALGLILNILIPMQIAICGSRSLSEKYTPKNRSKKYIAACIAFPILLVGMFYGTVFSIDETTDYNMATGLLLMLAIFVVALALAIVSAVIDPKATITNPQPQGGFNQPQPQNGSTAAAFSNINSQPSIQGKPDTQLSGKILEVKEDKDDGPKFEDN